MDKDAAEYTSSLIFDRNLFEYDIMTDFAHLIALNECGLISNTELKKLLSLLLQLYREGFNKLEASYDVEDVHIAIEGWLAEKVGNIAGKLQTARSRNDQVATDLRLAMREKLLELLDSLLSFERTILTFAERSSSKLAIGFTHLQHASPITFGHYFLAYFDMLLRDLNRAISAFDVTNRSPLGSGALATSSFRINRKKTAELLGFDSLVENSLDAVSSRDFLLDSTYASLSIMLTLSKLAEDIIIYSTTEFSIFELPDSLSSTSSIMPQKKNPDVAEIVRARTGMVVGEFTSIASILKALPIGYNRDLQEVSVHSFQSVRTATESIRIMNKVVKGLKINEERVREILSDGFSNATDLAEGLVKDYNINFRDAHRIVGKTVKLAIERKKALVDIDPKVLEGVIFEVTGRKVKVDKKYIVQLLNAERVLYERGTGGPSEREVKRMVDERKENLKRVEEEVKRRKSRVDESKKNLFDIVKKIVR